MSHGNLTNCDAALRFIESVADSTTRNLLNMAFTHLVKEVHLQKHRPAADIDMLFLMTALQSFFADHDVLRQTLNGEKVGAWFDDPTSAQNPIGTDPSDLANLSPIALKD
jgi:hypothetical protein